MFWTKLADKSLPSVYVQYFSDAVILMCCWLIDGSDRYSGRVSHNLCDKLRPFCNKREGSWHRGSGRAQQHSICLLQREQGTSDEWQWMKIWCNSNPLVWKEGVGVLWECRESTAGVSCEGVQTSESPVTRGEDMKNLGFAPFVLYCVTVMHQGQQGKFALGQKNSVPSVYTLDVHVEELVYILFECQRSHQQPVRCNHG